MIRTEYVRSVNCNYERILLDEKPDEKRYQYGILARGGVKGLLSCGLRFINGQAYLYYDISSRQNVAQLFSDRCIGREWIRDFAWSLRQIQQELGRFLLDAGNIVWYPEHVFQDLESNVFSFLYVPYHKEESSFLKLVEFWVEHIDYGDDILVDYVYRLYEQIAGNGEIYLQSRFFEDIKCLDAAAVREPGQTVRAGEEALEADGKAAQAGEGGVEEDISLTEPGEKDCGPAKTDKKGILGIFEGRKQRGKKIREDYRASMHQAMEEYAVAEDISYNEEPYGEEAYGQTIYIEAADETKRRYCLYKPEGKMLARLEKPVLSIGKKKEEVDLVLDDVSVSRLHARIIMDRGSAFLEDLNSTNGTFKNGLRLGPYEKRKLEEGDEIKCGKAVLIFR